MTTRLNATAPGAPSSYAPSEVQAPVGQEPVSLANGSCPPTYDYGSARCLAFAMLLALGFFASAIAAVVYGTIR